MAYVDLNQVPGNVFVVGTIAQPQLVARIAVAFRVDPADVTVDSASEGANVRIKGNVRGTMHDGMPAPPIVNDDIGRYLKRLLQVLPGGNPAKMQLAARRVAIHAKYRVGLERAQFLAIMGNLYDDVTDV